MVDVAGTGEISLDLTVLPRRGAGVGGGSFPAASKDVLSLSGCVKLLMKDIRLASVSFDAIVLKLGLLNVVSGVPSVETLFTTVFLGGGGAGRRTLCCSSLTPVSVFPVNNSLLKASTSRDFRLSGSVGRVSAGAGGCAGADANLLKVLQTALCPGCSG